MSFSTQLFKSPLFNSTRAALFDMASKDELRDLLNNILDEREDAGEARSRDLLNNIIDERLTASEACSRDLLNNILDERQSASEARYTQLMNKILDERDAGSDAHAGKLVGSLVTIETDTSLSSGSLVHIDGVVYVATCAHSVINIVNRSVDGAELRLHRFSVTHRTTQQLIQVTSVLAMKGYGTDMMNHDVVLIQVENQQGYIDVSLKVAYTNCDGSSLGTVIDGVGVVNMQLQYVRGTVSRVCSNTVFLIESALMEPSLSGAALTLRGNVVGILQGGRTNEDRQLRVDTRPTLRGLAHALADELADHLHTHKVLLTCVSSSTLFEPLLRRDLAVAVLLVVPAPATSAAEGVHQQPRILATPLPPPLQEDIPMPTVRLASTRIRRPLTSHMSSTITTTTITAARFPESAELRAGPTYPP